MSDFADKSLDMIERLQKRISKLEHDIAIAIGSNRFLDPPDGGDVSLAEQIKRMREALETAEAQSDAERDKENHMDCYQYGKVDAQSDAKGISISDETITIEWGMDGERFGPKCVKVERPASAGLIEAAEMAEKEARAGWAVSSLRDFAIKLRARAADRSGK